MKSSPSSNMIKCPPIQVTPNRDGLQRWIYRPVEPVLKITVFSRFPLVETVFQSHIGGPNREVRMMT